MPDPADLRVRGGAGGVRARLADIERSGELLRAIAGGLTDQGRAVLAVSLDLQPTAGLCPATFARAEAALAAAALGPGGLFALAARAELLGSGARTVADGYRTADALVAGGLRAAATLAGQVIGRAAGVLAPGLVVGAATVLTVVTLTGPAGGPAGASAGSVRAQLAALGGLTLRLLAGHCALTEAVIPVLPGVVAGLSTTMPGADLIAARAFGPAGPSTVPDLVAGLGVLGGLAGSATGGPPWFRDTDAVRVEVAPMPWQRPPRGTADLLRRIPTTPAHAPRLHLERLDTAAGRRWVVSIPGTANWSPVAGRTPFDLTGDLQLMAGQRSAGMTGVVQAMRAIGVRPGEPVLLVGHSQGGLIAAALAADPAVRREFSVTHVLTSGAPTASIPVPEQVQVLSIEHTDDLVPRLDGSVNRDRPHWITVTAPAPAAELPPAERAEPLLAHRAELYRRTAARIDRSTDPSIERWRSGLAGFLDRPGASGAGWDVEVTRAGTG